MLKTDSTFSDVLTMD